MNMTVDQITYLTFGIVLLGALMLDLGLMSKKNSSISMKKSALANPFLGFFGHCVLPFSLV